MLQPIIIANIGNKVGLVEELLTVREIAKLLKISPCSIYRMTHEGYMPHIKIGHSLRFSEKEVALWIAKRAKHGRKRREINLD